MRFELSKLSPNEKNTNNLASENFGQEIKSPIEVFWREFGQNFLDVEKADSARPKKLRIELKKVSDLKNQSFIENTLDPILPWLSATGKPDPKGISDPYVLVLYEENTIGLCGDTDPTTEPAENQFWVNFWFTEGKSTKTGDKNGRRGQGKITYFDRSSFQSLFAVTKRAEDDQTFLFGMCSLGGTFHMGGNRYRDAAYFCQEDKEGKYRPSGDKAEIKAFEDAFEISPRTDYGTTWVIPFVTKDKFEPQSIHEVLIQEYYFAILDEKLEVDVLGETLGFSTLDAIITHYSLSNPSKDKIEFLLEANTLPASDFVSPIDDNWLGATKRSELNRPAFNEQDIDRLKDAVEQGKTIGLNLPVLVSKKGQSTQRSSISIFLKRAENLTESDDQVVRSSLIIAKERPLSGVPGKYFGLIKAVDGPIAEFLAESEDPLHVQFNEHRVEKKYDDHKATLRRVRWSLGQLVRTLFRVDGRDSAALANIFAVPGSDGKVTISAKGTKGKPKPAGPKPKPPARIPRAFEIDQNGGKVRIKRSKDFTGKLSSRYDIHIAYETGLGVGNPFQNWSHADFNLSDTKFFPVTVSDASIISQSGNHIIVEITGTNPTIDVAGFNSVTDVCVKIVETV